MSITNDYKTDIETLETTAKRAIWQYITSASRCCDLSSKPGAPGKKIVKDNVKNLGNFYPWQWEEWMRFHSNLISSAIYHAEQLYTNLASAEHFLATLELVGKTSAQWTHELEKLCPQENLPEFTRTTKNAHDAAEKAKKLQGAFHLTHKEIIAREKTTTAYQDQRYTIASAMRIFIKTACGKIRPEEKKLHAIYRGMIDRFMTHEEETAMDLINDIYFMRRPAPGNFWQQCRSRTHSPLCAST